MSVLFLKYRAGRLFGVTLAAVFFLATLPAFAQTLTGHWAFDGDMTDQVGGWNASVPVGDAYAGTDNGLIGGAISFDGVGDIAQLPTEVLGDGPFTLSFWEYTETGGENGYFFAGNPANQFYLRRYNSTYGGSIRSNYINDTASPTIEAWHHNMVSYDTDGDIRWFVDGSFAGKSDPDNVNKTPFVSDGGVYDLGNRISDLNRSFKGKIDDLQIYSGATNVDQAGYLANNPGATLDTYVPTPAELVGHWKFDGNLNDEVGAFHGTAIGNAAAGTNNGVDGGGAVYFDGSDDAVTIDGDVLGSSKFSIAFWSKTDPADTDGYFIADGGNYRNLFLRRYSVEGNSTFSGLVNGIHCAFGPDGTLDTSWSKDVWHHQVLTYGAEEEDGLIQWYVDGQMMDAADVELPFPGLEGDLYLGNRGDLSRDFTGWLDDLQIYNWELSEEQVQLIYNSYEPVAALPGDANNDGTVNNEDATALAASWQSGPGATWSQGDFNGDGYVNDLDATLMAANWTTTTTAVPEPDTMAFLIGALLFVIPALRRQL